MMLSVEPVRAARSSAGPSPCNPVLPGFSPDPSLVRVGRDYYLITSTFQFLPAIALHHSRDLCSWTLIGHVFNGPSELNLTGFLDGCGVWAPDISHHDGEFFIFYCLVQLKRDRSVNVRGNYMVRSRSILGPWSAPVQLTTEGNDPSHFVDVDGSHHILYAAGIPRGRGVKIARLSDDCTRVVEAPRWLEFGGEKRAPEGPHLLHKDGHYYLTLASGGGAYDGHHQLIARSRHLHGPYEESPLGPFIVERSPTAAFYHHGHAKLVSTPEGAWHAAYLLRRRIGGFSPLGRETAIDAVTWRDDGWPELNGGAGPCELPRQTPPPIHEDFDADTLAPDWMFIRSPLPCGHDLSARPGHLRLSGGPSGPEEPLGVNAVLRRETMHFHDVTLRLELAGADGGEAGLLAYYDTSSHIAFTVCVGPARRILLRACDRGNPIEVATFDMPEKGPVQLRMRVRGLERTFEFSRDGRRWEVAGRIADCSFLSDEGTSNWGFTGTLVGPYARRAPGTGPLRADFDWITLTPAAEP